MICKLRPAVHFAPVRDGVSFQCWDESFVVSGSAALHTLFQGMLPALQRGTAREGILEAVPPGARRVAAYLIDQLVSHDMILDLEALSSGRLPAEEERRFRNTLSYLESLSPDPYAAFKRFREARVLAIGHGDSFFALTRALLDLGSKGLECCSFDAHEQRARLGNLLAGRAFTNVPLPKDEEALDLLQNGEWDAVVHVEDGADEARIARLENLTPRAIPMLQGNVLTQLGAFRASTRGTGRKGFGLVLERLTSRGHLAGEPAHHPSPVSPVLAALVGNLVALEAFNLLAGLENRSSNARVGIVRRELLESTFHDLEPDLGEDAREATVSEVHETFRAFEVRSTPRAFVEDADGLTDDMLGLLTAPHPKDLPQVPLNASVTEAIRPHFGDQIRRYGFGATEEEARYNALVEGLKALAWEALPEGPRLEALVFSDGEQGVERHVDRSRLVMAAGHSYEDWLADGLKRSLLERFAAGDARFGFSASNVRFADLGDGEPRRWWKILTLMLGTEVAVGHAVLKSLPDLHLCAVREGNETLSFGCGERRGEALVNALVGSAARVQVQASGYSLPPTATLGTATLTGGWGALEDEGQVPHGGGWALAASSRLQRSGFSVVARPLSLGPSITRRGLLLGPVGVVKDG